MLWRSAATRILLSFLFNWIAIRNLLTTGVNSLGIKLQIAETSSDMLIRRAELIIAYQAGKRAVFLFGFAKNVKDNIAPDDLAHWRFIGADLLAATEKAIAQAIADDELMEIVDE